MKFTTKSKEILKELQLVQGIIERKTTIPILSNLLIRIEEDKIELEATDLEVGLRCKTSGNIQDKGSITVNARKMFDLVRSLPEMELQLETLEDKNLQITGENVQYRIPILPASEYPGIPETDLSQTAKIPAKLIKTAIAKTIIASAIDDTRYTLNGIFVQIKKEGSTFVATDAHRLSVYNFDDKIENLNEDVEFILPRKGAQELMDLIKEAGDDDKLDFKMDGNNLFFKFKDRLLVSRMIEGKYPQYEKVIPKDNDKKIKFNREEILRILGRVDLVASEKSHAVIFELENSTIKFRSSSPEFGEGEEKVKIDYSGDDFKIAFNARYLIDFLNNTEVENVIFNLKDDKTAGLFQDEKSDNHKYVVSPIKL